MSEKKINEVISLFSKKMNRFSKSVDAKRVVKETKESRIKKQIEFYEQERIDFIKKQFLDFQNPITQDIEKDEESLVKAFELYKSLSELNSNLGTKDTFIASKKINSPICKKSEYIHKDKFSYLRLWFIKNYTSENFVPIIVKTDNNFFLEFIHIEEYKYTSVEKEILQVIECL